MKREIVFLVLPALVACATSYDSTKHRQLAEDTFQVRFQGNAWTDHDMARTYVLYHCAEVTLDNGFEWFRIVDDADTRELHGWGGSGSVSEMPGFVVEIICGRGTRPVRAKSYDAKDLKRRLQADVEG